MWYLPTQVGAEPLPSFCKRGVTAGRLAMARQFHTYHFERKFTENRFCQTWLANRTPLGEPCVVKIASQDSAADFERTNRFLAASFLLQRPLHFRGILRATRCQTENGLVTVEYPYLEPSDWQVLTPEYFLKNLVELLPQVCLAPDYLHVLGLVHGDLKLENFLVNSGSKRVVLTDLDFLCRDESELNATIFGTPDHIPPEVAANEMVTVQSDNYSLGISLGRYLERADETDAVVQELKSNLPRLTDPDYVKRPRILLDFLAEGNLLSADQLDQAERILVGSFLLTRLRSTNQKRLSDPAKLDSFIHEDCRLFGFHSDAIELLAESFSVSRTRTFRAVVELVAESTLVRHSDSWHTNSSLGSLGEFYEKLEAIVAPRHKSPISVVKPEALLQRAQDLAKEGHPERSLVIYCRLLGEDGSHHPCLASPSDLELLAEAGRQATQTDRMQIAREYYDAALNKTPAGSTDRLRFLLEVAVACMQLQALSQADEFIAEGLAAEPTRESWPYLLKIRRLRAWRLMSSSKYDAAKKEFDAIITDAQKHEAWEAEALARYSLGVAEHQQGKYPAALTLLTDASDLAKSKSLTDLYPAIATMLAYTYFGLCRYAECLRSAELGVEAAAASHSTSVESSLYQILSLAYLRLGMYAKARFWLERCRRARLERMSLRLLQSNWADEGAIRFQEGNIQGAETALRRALEFGRITSFNDVAKIYFILAELYVQQGKPDRAGKCLEEARKEFLKADDCASLVEVELQGLLLRAQYESNDLCRELAGTVTRLMEQSRWHFCSTGVLQLLLLDEGAARDFLKEMDKGALNFLSRSGNPLMQAVDLLAETAKYETSFAERAGAWKRAFSILAKFHYYFWASSVAIRLGELYLEQGLPKHSRKFFKKGADLAGKLPNPLLEKRALSGLKRAEQATGDLAGLISSYVSISEILKEVADFQGSLNRLIRFAVEQTGAERGVLLLKRPDSPGLQIGAAVNCDDQSLNDVLTFSSKLPESAFRESLPIIIEDATADERTKGYKSVVMHNVLSVVCLPLVNSGDSLGVLYLDHHSIPALFEPEDLHYIESIANFLTVFLVTAQELRHLNTAQAEMLAELNRLGVTDGFISQDPAMLRLLEQLPQIARTNASVLLLGESGTGKELLCNMIQKLSLRVRKPFKKLNCASIAHAQMESELFGVAKNAFTGVAGREGKLEIADGGTLFLDEIGDMPLELQAKVLRMVENQEFERVGGNDSKRVDIRFIYATNKDLRRLVAEGKFREDLLYRINTIAIEVPPLRQRIQDIPLLIEHYIKVFSEDRPAPHFSSAARDKLLSYSWPGNARELRNMIERACILYPGERIDPPMLPKEIATVRTDPSLGRTLSARAEAAAIREALVREKGVQSRAAQRLGIPLTTLRRKIEKYRISVEQ